MVAGVAKQRRRGKKLEPLILPKEEVISDEELFARILGKYERKSPIPDRKSTSYDEKLRFGWGKEAENLGPEAKSLDFPEFGELS